MSQYVNFITNTSWVDISSMFTIDVDTIMDEIYQMEEQFVEERDEEQYLEMQSNKSVGIGERLDNQHRWSAMTLYSSSGKSTDILTQGILPNHNKQSYRESFRNLRKHSWTDLSIKMPNTTRILQEQIGKYMKFSYIKIARLDANGIVPEHTDMPQTDFGFNLLKETNTYNMLNSFLVELNCPAGVKATHDGVELKYKKGSVFFCNQSKSHGTVNNGSEVRYNLRIQGLHNKLFRNQFMKNISSMECYPDIKMH